ncbi:MAG TPA: cupredoxin domain-containing protein [Solirubrobacterales bacterium]|nr:cupredoxin domain-containing protein [Solirubrobacterales bacterium]
MNRKHLLPLAVMALALVAGLTACGSSEEAPAGAKTISFKLTDAGCEPHDAKAPAGPIAFEIENAGTSKVTEMEIMEGDKVLGEEENITDGLSGSFSVTLGAGEYTIYCPGGSEERGTLTVTGAEQVEGASKGESDGDEEK